MTEHVTILLASTDAHLLDDLACLDGGRDVVRWEDVRPTDRFSGRLCAFVEWLLPELSGLELCRRLREAENTNHAHVTMVLESTDADVRRRALAAGADDYMLGPLTPEAVLKRISSSAGNERPRSGSAARLRHGDITIDLGAFQARYKEKLLPLRPNEFRLLVHFVENPDQVFSRTSLIDRLGKDSEAVDERTVDVWVGRLRRGLRAHGVPDPLRTVRSLGYVMDSITV